MAYVYWLRVLDAATTDSYIDANGNAIDSLDSISPLRDEWD